MEAHTEAGPSSIAESDDSDTALSKSEYLTREELMRRRARRLRRLAKCYRDHYWLLMEVVRRKHREFIWKNGVDSYDHEYDVVEVQNGFVFARNRNDNRIGEIYRNSIGDDVSNNGKLGLGFGEGSFNRCDSPNCRSKAMAMTSYCLLHIMSDTNQVLYKKCQYPHQCYLVLRQVVHDDSCEKPIICGKPILRSTVPPLCQNHIKPTEQNIRRALKKGGASTAVSTRMAPKFHLILTEYVRMIQAKRRGKRAGNLANQG